MTPAMCSSEGELRLMRPGELDARENGKEGEIDAVAHSGHAGLLGVAGDALETTG